MTAIGPTETKRPVFVNIDYHHCYYYYLLHRQHLPSCIILQRLIKCGPVNQISCIKLNTKSFFLNWKIMKLISKIDFLLIEKKNYWLVFEPTLRLGGRCRSSEEHRGCSCRKCGDGWSTESGAHRWQPAPTARINYRASCAKRRRSDPCQPPNRSQGSSRPSTDYPPGFAQNLFIYFHLFWFLFELFWFLFDFLISVFLFYLFLFLIVYFDLFRFIPIPFCLFPFILISFRVILISFCFFN